jgi:hypothetical protein
MFSEHGLVGTMPVGGLMDLCVVDRLENESWMLELSATLHVMRRIYKHLCCAFFLQLKFLQRFVPVYKVSSPDLF